LPRRQKLRFSRSGDPAIEASYQTHWISPELSKKKREHLAEKARRAPELVVIQPLNSGWTCHRCGGTGDLLVMETPGPACLRCVDLDDLEYLPAGDALLTRRAKAKSTRYAVVVASAGAVAATNDRVCCSSRRPWQMRNDASNVFVIYRQAELHLSARPRWRARAPLHEPSAAKKGANRKTEQAAPTRARGKISFTISNSW
jgi:hypothetical protein